MDTFLNVDATVMVPIYHSVYHSVVKISQQQRHFKTNHGMAKALGVFINEALPSNWKTINPPTAGHTK